MHNRIVSLALFACCLAASASAQIYDTEVWVGKLNIKDGQFAVSDLANLSNHPGYDNQPAFFAGGTTLVFTSETDDLSDTGLGLHAIRYDLATGTATPLPDARGFSPTPTADGKGLMMLREGRVWLHGLDGKELRPLTETKDAGYYTRFDDRAWVLFMNDKDRRIVLYDAVTKALETMDTGAITPPYPIPGQRAVTFVTQDESKARTLKRLDLKTKKVTVLDTIRFPTGGHHVWTSRGTLLMASGPEIHEWNPAHAGEWPVVWRTDDPELQGITRIALSPAGDRIALVSTPRDETVIRDSRAASNAALAKRNAAGVAALLRKDASVTASSGMHYDGAEAVEKGLTEQFTKLPDLVYVRTPLSITISRSDAAASERGTWTGHWTTPEGAVERSGEYMAVWRRELSDNGTASWTIASELFAALEERKTAK